MNDHKLEPGRDRRFQRLVGGFGWLGTIAILAAYILNINHYLDTSSVPYLGLNFIGSLAICGVCWVRRTWQPFALNIVWGGIALHALVW